MDTPNKSLNRTQLGRETIPDPFKGPNDSFEIANEGRNFKKVPSTFSEILNPFANVVDPLVPQTESQILNRDKLFDSLLSTLKAIADPLRSISEDLPKDIDFSKYSFILPDLPSTKYPPLRKKRDGLIKELDIDPVYIVKLIMDHITTYSALKTFDPQLIPPRVRQDLLEGHTGRSYSNYTADYKSLINTVRNLNKWTKDEDIGNTVPSTTHRETELAPKGWYYEFSKYLQDDSDQLRKMMQKSYEYCLLLLTFYFYAAKEYGAMGYKDLVSFWSLTLAERQGQDIVDSINTVQESFVYKYNKLAGVVEANNNNLLERYREEARLLLASNPDSDNRRDSILIIPDNTRSSILDIARRTSDVSVKGTGAVPTKTTTTAPTKTTTATIPTKVTSPPTKATVQINVPVPPQPIASKKSKLYDHYTTAYIYLLSTLLSEFRRLMTKIIISQEFHTETYTDEDVKKWKTMSSDALSFVKSELKPVNGTQLNTLVEALERCTNYIYNGM